MVVKRVTFNEKVTVASLPKEEWKEAYNARRGHWGSAPNCDELWDGDRRVFWERELTTEELKEILRFRRLARYASMLQGVGIFGLKVPMPKIPHVIEELVAIARLQHQQQSDASPKSESERLSERYGIDPIALPSEDHENSSRFSAGGEHFPYSHREPVPTHKHHKVHATHSDSPSVASVDEIYNKKDQEQFEFTNPSLDKSRPASTRSTQTAESTTTGASVHPVASPTNVAEDKKRLSSSQKAAMMNVGKVLRLNTPRMGHAVHKSRSRRSRAKKRISAHAILQPWFVILYILVPLLLLASIYAVPFWRSVYLHWKDQKVFKTAIEVPKFIERVLRVPDVPILQSTVYIGLFAFEVTGVIYLLLVGLSQLTMFVIVRPLILSLIESYADKGAAVD